MSSELDAFVGLSLQYDFENWSLKPTAAQEAGLIPLFDQLESWSAALALPSTAVPLARATLAQVWQTGQK